MDDKTDKNRAAAYRILAVETILTAAITLLLFISVDFVVAYSAALGGLAHIVPNAFFTRYVFRHSAARSAALAVRWFYLGEAVKVLMTVLLFAAAFVWVQPVNAAALFLTYALMLIVNLPGTAYLMNR